MIPVARNGHLIVAVDKLYDYYGVVFDTETSTFSERVSVVSIIARLFWEGIPEDEVEELELILNEAEYESLQKSRKNINFGIEAEDLQKALPQGRVYLFPRSTSPTRPASS